MTNKIDYVVTATGVRLTVEKALFELKKGVAMAPKCEHCLTTLVYINHSKPYLRHKKKVDCTHKKIGNSGRKKNHTFSYNKRFYEFILKVTDEKIAKSIWDTFLNEYTQKILSKDYYSYFCAITKKCTDEESKKFLEYFVAKFKALSNLREHLFQNVLIESDLAAAYEHIVTTFVTNNPAQCVAIICLLDKDPNLKNIGKTLLKGNHTDCSVIFTKLKNVKIKSFKDLSSNSFIVIDKIVKGLPRILEFVNLIEIFKISFNKNLSRDTIDSKMGFVYLFKRTFHSGSNTIFDFKIGLSRNPLKRANNVLGQAPDTIEILNACFLFKARTHETAIRNQVISELNKHKTICIPKGKSEFFEILDSDQFFDCLNNLKEAFKTKCHSLRDIEIKELSEIYSNFYKL